MFKFENDEQAKIRAAVATIAHAEIPQYQSPQHYNKFPRALFDSLATAGFSGLSINEEYEGIQASATTAMIVMEELAAVDLGPAIFISVHSMVSGLIQKFGDNAQKEKFLPTLARGEKLAAFALTEPAAGSDAAAITTTAQAQGDDFIVNGEKCYITSAGFADLYLVFAKTDPGKGNKGISAFLVDAALKGVDAQRPEQKMGCELSPIASLRLDSVKLPHSALLGNLNEGYQIALSALAGGRVNIAACANGISRSALDRALAFTKERKQFGQQIVDFQGIQFMLADMKMKLEASQLLVWQAAQQLDKKIDNDYERALPSIAKCFATDSAMSISTDAVQLLGGAGYIKDYQVERLMREAKMLQIVEGTNQIQRMVIARELRR